MLNLNVRVTVDVEYPDKERDPGDMTKPFHKKKEFTFDTAVEAEDVPDLQRKVFVFAATMLSTWGFKEDDSVVRTKKISFLSAIQEKR